jgi:hypothetical protein
MIIAAEELPGARGIHLPGAGIQSSFTSPFLGFALRRGEAVGIRDSARR